MIVLDTNVVSELLRLETDANVARWIAGRSRNELAVTAVAIFEIRFGLRLMSPSRRQTDLAALLEEFLKSLEADALLPFDAAAADHAAAFRAARQKAGRPVGVPDSLIAGTALRHGAALATRNVRDFEASGLDLVDPWQAAPS